MGSGAPRLHDPVGCFLAAFGDPRCRTSSRRRSSTTRALPDAGSANTHLRDVSLEAPRGDILDRNRSCRSPRTMTGYSIRLIATTRGFKLRAVLQARLDALIPDELTHRCRGGRWCGAGRRRRIRRSLVYASGRYNVVATLEEHRAALPGLVIQKPKPRRRYPDGDGRGAHGGVCRRGQRRRILDAGTHLSRAPPWARSWESRGSSGRTIRSSAGDRACTMSR